MLKRSIAWVLVLALLVSVMPKLSLGVTAEGTATPPAEHSHSATQHDCEHCDASIAWEVWDGTTAMENGKHYYLNDDVDLSASVTINSGVSVVLCLNGYNINGGYNSEDPNSSKSFQLFKVNGGELTISDCTAGQVEGAYRSGRLQNCYVAGGTGAVYVYSKGKLTMHAGIFDNNHNYQKTTTDGGVGYSGGAINLRGGATVTLNNVVFSNNDTNMQGGAIAMPNEATLTATNCTFMNNEAGPDRGYGGAIYARAGTVTLNSCTFNGNVADNGGAVYVGALKDTDKACTLTMTSCTFNGNVADNGGAVYASGFAKDCAITMTSCSFSENEVGTNPDLNLGGAIYLNAGAATLNSCTFTTNKAAKGGAIYTTGSELAMSGCTMDGNESTATTGSGAGGALYLHSTTAMLDTCSILNSVAKVAGGSAIYTTNSSDVTLKDCSVTGNKFTSTGTGSKAAVYMTKATDKLTVSGKTVIDGNYAAFGTSDQIERNIFLQEKAVIDIGGLTEGASLSIWTHGNKGWGNVGADETPHMVTSATAPATWKRLWVIYDNNGMAVDYNTTDDFHFAKATDHIHCECGDWSCTETGETHEKLEYMPWNGETKGDYYLTGEEVKLTEAVEVDGELNLCLHGCDIVIEGNRGFNLRGTDALTITDCTAEPGQIRGAKNSAVMLENNAESKTVFNLYNGIFTANNATAGGAAVLVQGGGTFNMYGGTLTENTVAAVAAVDKDGNPVLDDKNVQKVSGQYGGGAVMLFKENATFNMYGGTISGNSATSCQRQKADGTLEAVGGTGGAIYTEGTVNLYGGSISGNKADRNGGGIYATGKGAVVTVSGGEIYKNEAKSAGGAIITVNESRLALEGGKVTENEAENGAGVYISTNTSLTMTGGEISGNTATGNGGGIYLYRGTATLSGGAVSGNTAVNGGGILCEGGTVYLKGANLIKNIATKNGGGVKTALASKTYPAAVVISGGSVSENTAALAGGVLLEGAGSQMTMTGGDISKNTASGEAGGIWVSTNTIWTMEGGKISDNTAESGGGVVLFKTTATMTGGEIVGNTAQKNGGGILFDQSTLKLSGGTVSDNKAGSAGAGVYLPEDSALELSGEPVIVGNTANDKANNLYLCGKVLVSVGELGENARIAVSAQEAFRAISGECTDGSGKFLSDKTTLQVVYQNKALYLTATGEHKHCACMGKLASGCSHDVVTYAEWDDPNRLPSTGSWYLAVDVTASEAVEVDGELNLCLHGCDIVIEGNRGFNLRGTDKLVITDCEETPGQISGAKTSAVMLENNAESKTVFDLYNGIFTGNSATSGGGAVLVQGSGTFNMYGGSLTGNTVAAAAKVDKDGNPVLDDKKVQTVSGEYGGGAVMLFKENATFNMYGGTISGNSATSCQRLDENGKLEDAGGTGGAIYTEGTVNLYGGTISGNKADRNGGAVYASGKGAVVKLEGGVLSKNEAKYGGAVITVNRGSLELKSGKVTGNTATNGGGLYISTNTGLTMTGGEVSGNTATGNGGGVYLYRGTATLSGGAVSGNAAVNGGGILSEGGTVYLKGTNVIKNTATGNGGGVKTAVASDTYPATVVMSAGTVSENTAALAGGVLLEGAGSKMTMTGGDISKNTAAGEAGGAYASTKTVFTMEGGKISDNTANTGGGVVLHRTTGTFTGGELSGNKAVQLAQDGKTTGGHGGAVYVAKESKVSLGGCKITGNTADNSGGGIYTNGAEAVVTIDGCEVSGNQAKNGGAILMATRSHLAFVSGKVTGNTSISNGGGLYISTNTTFDMTGGQVSGNKANGNGGGIYLLRSVANLSGGEVSGNEGVYGGGGILCKGSTLNLKGTDIIQNTTSKNGGGIKTGIETVSEKDVYVSKVVMSTGKISGNTAALGGGILLEGAGSEMTMTDGEISQNTASDSAGGIWVSTKAAWTMEGGKITGNTANNGGGIVVFKAAATFTGGEISGNKAKTNAGGAYIRHKESNAVFENITITGNSATNGGGVLVANGATLVMKSGKVSGNTTTKNGAGMYISTESGLKMSGGSITGNTAESAGGGIYGLQATMTLSGGSVSNNSAYNGGGIYNNGGDLYLYGTAVTGNMAEKGVGGGVNTGRRVVKKNGVETSYPARIFLNGSVVSGNTAKTGGGVVMSGNGGAMEMHSGTISNNISTGSCGGLYVSAKCTLTMTGGRITGNKAEKSGGGVYSNKSTMNYTGGEIDSNISGTAGGGMYFTSNCVCDMKNVSIHDNAAGTVGGAAYINNDSIFTVSDSQFANNTAGTRGGALYGAPGVALTAANTSFTGNTAVELGGALCVRDIADLTDCTLTGNKAEKGGAIYAGNTDKTYAVNGWGTKGSEVGVVVKNCTVSDNHATGQGGGLYLTMSAFTDMQDTVITGNTSGAEGSGIWAEEDLTMVNVSVTGNTSENGGYAVYLADSEYDGQTYIKGLMKMGGDMIITDNQGGDMFLGNLVTVMSLSQGYGEKTNVNITLDSGLLTQRVFGSYNYEGGNCVYTITYGDRSMTEPEYAEPVSEETAPTEGTEGTQATEPANENTLLYAGVGAFAVVIAAIAVIVVLLSKKKKAGKAAVEVSQE